MNFHDNSKNKNRKIEKKSEPKGLKTQSFSSLTRNYSGFLGEGVYGVDLPNHGPVLEVVHATARDFHCSGVHFRGGEVRDLWHKNLREQEILCFFYFSSLLTFITQKTILFFDYLFIFTRALSTFEDEKFAICGTRTLASKNLF